MPLREFNNVVNCLYKSVNHDSQDEKGKKVQGKLLRFLAILRPILVDVHGTDDDGKLLIESESPINELEDRINCPLDESINKQQNHVQCNVQSNVTCKNEDCGSNVTCDLEIKNSRSCKVSKYQSVSLVMRTLNNLIHRMPIKDGDEILEGRIHLIFPFYLDFLEEFLDSLSANNLSRLHKDNIVTCLLSLLYHPVIYLDLRAIEDDDDEEEEDEDEDNEDENEDKEEENSPNGTAASSQNGHQGDDESCHHNYAARVKIKSKSKKYQEIENDDKNPFQDGGYTQYQPGGAKVGILPPIKFCHVKPLKLNSSIDQISSVTASLVCATRVIELITKFEVNLFKIYDKYESISCLISSNYSYSSSSLSSSADQDYNHSCYYNEDGNEIRINCMPLALGILGYISIGCQFVPSYHFIPSIYNHDYVLSKHVPYVSRLLSSPEILIHSKGLKLSKVLISNLELNSLDASFHEILRNHDFDVNLIKIMIFSPDEKIRISAVRTFKSLLDAFNLAGKFQLLICNLSHPDIYPSSASFLINCAKSLLLAPKPNSGNIDQDKKDKDKEQVAPLVVNNLISISMKLSLPAGTETDLSEHHEVILETLNLIRFILLQSKSSTARATNGATSSEESDETSSRSNSSSRLSYGDINISEIEKKLLDPLRSALELSRAHFKLELNKLQNETMKNARTRRIEAIKELKSLDCKVLNELKKSSKKNRNSKCSNSNSSSDLLNLPENHEKSILQMSLTKFDLIQSILSRVTELLE